MLKKGKRGGDKGKVKERQGEIEKGQERGKDRERG